MTADVTPRPDTSFNLTWEQEHQAARVVASASVDAEDCAMLLAVLGLNPARPRTNAKPGRE
jgi:lysophospholipid acyltransferase (LPLAT)-like uncharacterized protein